MAECKSGCIPHIVAQLTIAQLTSKVVEPMGFWESALPDYCADCGDPLREPRTKQSKSGRRIDIPKHYYLIGSPVQRKVCPACFVTARTAPTVKRLEIA